MHISSVQVYIIMIDTEFIQITCAYFSSQVAYT